MNVFLRITACCVVTGVLLAGCGTGDDIPYGGALISPAEARHNTDPDVPAAVVVAAPSVPGGEGCGIRQPVQVVALGGTGRTTVKPGAIVDARLASALGAWETAIQKSAMRAFGVPVASMATMASYACRNILGNGPSNKRSQHAFGLALDVGVFTLANGDRVIVLEDWHRTGAKQRFLRESFDAACRIFGTTLGPDYNAAHRNHFHVDLARGRFCR